MFTEVLPKFSRHCGITRRNRKSRGSWNKSTDWVTELWILIKPLSESPHSAGPSTRSPVARPSGSRKLWCWRKSCQNKTAQAFHTGGSQGCLWLSLLRWSQGVSSSWESWASCVFTPPPPPSNHHHLQGWPQCWGQFYQICARLALSPFRDSVCQLGLGSRRSILFLSTSLGLCLPTD